MSVSNIGSASGFDPTRMAAEFFKKADADGDGGIDKAEFKTMRSNGPGGSKATQDVDEMFAQVDTDGNGSISQTENEDFLKKMSEEMQSRAGKAGGAGGPPPGGGGAQKSSGSGGGSDSKVYDSKDTNKDGTVSFEEEMAWAAKHPEENESSGSDSKASNDDDKVKSAINDLMNKLQSGTKYSQQGTINVSTNGTQGLFSIFA